MLKQFGMALGIGIAGVFVGFTIATLLLYPQITNREAAGRSEGFSHGANHVVGFIAKSLKPNHGRASRNLDVTLQLRDNRLSLIDIDGVLTLRVDE